MSSICDDRGQELLYAGMPITDVIKDRWSSQSSMVQKKVNSYFNSFKRNFYKYLIKYITKTYL